MVNAYRPKNLDEALKIRGEKDVIPIAGGTDLMVRYRNISGATPRFEKPVLFVGHLEEIKNIEIEDSFIKIGSSATLTSLLQNKDIPSILKSAVLDMAAPTVRNIGTIGGNICNASPAGDTLPPLYALGSRVILTSAEEVRNIPIDKFIKGPGQTDLRDNELLTEILIPIQNFDREFYKKVGTRKAMALSKLSFVGLAKIDGEKIADIRIAFGAIAPTVVRSREIEQEIIGHNVDEIAKLSDSIVSKYSGLFNPIDDQRSNKFYRNHISMKLLQYFLNEIIG